MKVLVLLALVTFASGAGLSKAQLSRARAAQIEANLNTYFDGLLGNLRQFVAEHGLDPLSLPDHIEEFTAKGLIITWHGELALTHGSLSDLSTLNRKGDIIADYENEMLDVKATIGFGDVKFSFDYLIELMNVGFTGVAEGTVADLTLELEFLVNLANFTAKLENFKVEHTGALSVELHGNGLLDIIANTVIGIVTTLFKNVIMDVVGIEVKKVLDEALSQFHLSSFLEQVQS